MTSNKHAVVCMLTLEVIFIILFAIFAKYGKDSSPTTPEATQDHSQFVNLYPMFQDVHVMMFIGFGFLMVFLKRYGYSAVSFTLLVSALVIQWGILCYGFFRMENGKINIDIKSMLTADILCGAVLISFGAVLGKTSPLQLIIMAVFETVLFAANEYLGSEVLKAVDAGGSMYVHAFGAYFGLTVSLLLQRGVVSPETSHKLDEPTYQSDIMALIGTIFLWMFWPSFNASLVSGDQQYRAVINTYLALTASCITTFAISALFAKHNKFDIVHIQNATLAGGVCVGTAADMMVQPYGALIIGFYGGLLSTMGYHYLQGFLLRTIRLHDTCGVHNLHGMTGISGGLIGAIMASLATKETYGSSLYEEFPGRAPADPTELSKLDMEIEPGFGRSASVQAGFQLIALGITLIIAIVGGLITGMTLNRLPKASPIQHFDDYVFWKLPTEDETILTNVDTRPVQGENKRRTINNETQNGDRSSSAIDDTNI